MPSPFSFVYRMNNVIWIFWNFFWSISSTSRDLVYMDINNPFNSLHIGYIHSYVNKRQTAMVDIRDSAFNHTPEPKDS